eukprot:RCo050721
MGDALGDDLDCVLRCLQRENPDLEKEIREALGSAPELPCEPTPSAVSQGLTTDILTGVLGASTHNGPPFEDELEKALMSLHLKDPAMELEIRGALQDDNNALPGLFPSEDADLGQTPVMPGLPSSSLPNGSRLCWCHPHRLVMDRVVGASACKNPEGCACEFFADEPLGKNSRWRCIVGCDFTLCERCSELYTVPPPLLSSPSLCSDASLAPVLSPNPPWDDFEVHKGFGGADVVRFLQELSNASRTAASDRATLGDVAAIEPITTPEAPIVDEIIPLSMLLEANVAGLLEKQKKSFIIQLRAQIRLLEVQYADLSAKRAQKLLPKTTKFSEGLDQRSQPADLPAENADQSLEPFLDILAKLELEQAEEYWVCQRCEGITSDLADHLQSRHAGATVDPHEAVVRPTMALVVSKARVKAQEVMEGKAREGEGGPLSGVSFDDAAALHVYSLETEIYKRVNRGLRNNDGAEIGRWRDVIRHIHRALAAVPALRPAVQLYRGLDVKVHKGLYVEGHYVVWPAFSSSTTDADVVKRFFGQGRGTAFIIQPRPDGTMGKPIKYFSGIPDEEEVLFTYNQWFRVVQWMSTGPKQLLGDSIYADLTNVDVIELAEVSEKEAQEGMAKTAELVKTATAEALQAVSKFGYDFDNLSRFLAQGADVTVPLEDAFHNPMLLEAVQQNRMEAVTLLLSAKADPNGRNDLGVFPLLHAMQCGRLSVCSILIAAKADVNQCSGNGASALLVAVEAGSLEGCTLLLAAKADPNICTRSGLCPIISAVIRNRENRVGIAIVDLLLDAKADVNSRDVLRNLCPLLVSAIAFGQKEVALHILAKTGRATGSGILDVNAMTSTGETALHRAIEANNLQLCVSLLANGADVTAVSNIKTCLSTAKKELQYLVDGPCLSTEGDKYSEPPEALSIRRADAARIVRLVEVNLLAETTALAMEIHPHPVVRVRHAYFQWHCDNVSCAFDLGFEDREVSRATVECWACHYCFQVFCGPCVAQNTSVTPNDPSEATTLAQQAVDLDNVPLLVFALRHGADLTKPHWSGSTLRAFARESGSEETANLIDKLLASTKKRFSRARSILTRSDRPLPLDHSVSPVAK